MFITLTTTAFDLISTIGRVAARALISAQIVHCGVAAELGTILEKANKKVFEIKAFNDGNNVFEILLHVANNGQSLSDYFIRDTRTGSYVSFIEYTGQLSEKEAKELFDYVLHVRKCKNLPE